MNFIGATRKQLGSSLNNDAFVCCGGSFSFLMDGAGNCGKTQRLANLIKNQPLEITSFKQLVALLNFSAVGLGIESTLVGVHLRGTMLTGVSIGNSTVHLLRDGSLIRLNETTRGRLGANPEMHHFAAVLKKYDCLLLCTDGVTLERYRLVQTLQRYLLRPTELPQAILEAQKDSSDDVTAVTRVV